MPSYTMKSVETQEVKEMILSLKERDELLETGKWIQMLSTANFISQSGSTLAKTSDGWKDILKTIKGGSGKSNTIHD